MKPLLSALLCALLLANVIPAAAEPMRVPNGNRFAEQPAIPGASARRTRASASSFEAKYKTVMALLATDAALRRKIQATADTYGIDPVHIAGAIVGEHTYNVDAMDRLQSYYVKAAAYLTSSVRFAHDGESVTDFVSRPQFERCESLASDEALWSCREAVFDTEFRGRTIDGTRFPDDRFGAVFFQPLYAGQTFGLGQINPLTALSVSDVVGRTSGRRALDADDAPGVYAAVMDPDRSLETMGAVIAGSISAYREIADFDISGNPGIVATLYNVGNPRQRAARLKAENAKRRASGLGPRLPEENYYGWLVNERLDELRALFTQATATR